MTPFALIDARSAADAAALLRAHAPHAQAIAAGGDLLGLLKEGVEGPTLPAPTVLVNLATAGELAEITHDALMLRIGAMVPLAGLAREPRLPVLLQEAIAHIASPQLRARTTLGGNLLQRPRCWYFRHPDIVCFKKGGSGCPAVGGPEQAHPGALFPGLCQAGHPSDLAPALIALHASALITSPNGTRTLPLHALYADAASSPESEASLRRDEVLTALVVPQCSPAQAFEKMAPREANEFAWAGVAVVLEPSGDVIGGVRMAASGIAPGPWLFDGAAALLVSQRPADVDVAHVARQLLSASPRASMRAAREATAHVAIERALARALQRWPVPTHNAR